jgi:hypothetical protein
MLRAYTDQQQCEPVALMCVVNVFGRVAMPDITETAGLEVQIEALIRKASDHLRRQLDDFRRNADSRCDQSQELKEAYSERRKHCAANKRQKRSRSSPSWTTSSPG